MADKLLIIMSNSDPDNPTQLGPPLLQATVAAAMEYDVEVVLTGRSGEIAVKGVAEKLKIHRKEGAQTLYSIIQQAHQAGVKFKVCAPVLDDWGDELIEEISETVGGAYIVSEAMDSGTVTLTY